MNSALLGMVIRGLPASFRRRIRIAITALMTPVSSKSMQTAMSHEPRSGHAIKTSYQVAPEELVTKKTTPARGPTARQCPR